ncbi:peptidylprolyl isomerase [archaeon]|nr:peptidylprolyl isomerase [archaeon]
MKVKKGDFVELDFVGRLEDGKVFDLNNKEVAEKEGLKHSLDRVVVCVGEREVVKGLDDSLVDKEVGKDFKVDVPAEKAFGKRDGKLFQLIAANKFKDQEIRPFPGLQINIDGMVGIIKTVSGGRVMVDFNHPLAGRDLKYDAKILKIVDDVNDKVEFSLKNMLGKKVPFEFKEGKLVVKFEFPNEISGMIEENLKKRIKEIKDIEFKK